MRFWKMAGEAAVAGLHAQGKICLRRKRPGDAGKCLLRRERFMDEEGKGWGLRLGAVVGIGKRHKSRLQAFASPLWWIFSRFYGPKKWTNSHEKVGHLFFSLPHFSHKNGHTISN
jgi:hypothetical protein